jgi:hypothetical protein
MENWFKVLLGVLVAIIILQGVLIFLGTGSSNSTPAQNNVGEISDDSSKLDEKGTEDEINLTPYEHCMNSYNLIAYECEAIKKQDISICNNSEDKNWGGWCKARVTKDKSHCEPLKDEDFWDYHNCLIDTAKTVEDCKAIDFSNEPYEINECMAYVTKDVSYCDKLPEKDKIDCKASLQKDEDLCEDNPVFERKWNCLMKNSDDENICKRYHKSFVKSFTVVLLMIL